MNPLYLDNRKAKDQKGYFVGGSLHNAGQLQKTTRRGTAKKEEKRRGKSLLVLSEYRHIIINIICCIMPYM